MLQPTAYLCLGTLAHIAFAVAVLMVVPEPALSPHPHGMAAAGRAARFLTAAEAARIDAALMSTPGFSLDQLMELAGLAVASSVYQQYPPARNSSVLVVAGPGNNGGDGLVAARHLWHFGYKPSVVYPKRPSKGSSVQLFQNLVQQLEDLDIPISDVLPDGNALLRDPRPYDLIIDAIFGFSFKGELRAPFDSIVATLGCVSDLQPAAGGDQRFEAVSVDASSASVALLQRRNCTIARELSSNRSMQLPGVPGIPVVSIDIPSGWSVEASGSELAEYAFHPSMLVSLTGAYAHRSIRDTIMDIGAHLQADRLPHFRASTCQHLRCTFELFAVPVVFSEPISNHSRGYSAFRTHVCLQCTNALTRSVMQRPRSVPGISAAGIIGSVVGLCHRASLASSSWRAYRRTQAASKW